MTARDITIWTTGLILIATIIAPYIDVFVLPGGSGYSPVVTIFVVIYFCSMVWLFSGSPMAVTFLIARKLKHDIPAAILLVSSIAYSVLFVYAQYQTFIGTGGDMVALWLFAPLGSLWWMIPAWVLALILNRYYVKKAISNPETTPQEDLPSSPISPKTPNDQ